MKAIGEFPNLPKSSPDYVEEGISERRRDIQGLPDEVKRLLVEARDTIVDVGPGEGISSMALGLIAKDTTIVGIEMDSRHLVCAWPKCREYNNVQLYWGTLPGTPSNPLVNRDIPSPPTAELRDQYCSILFSWIGMSRRDIFEAGSIWSRIVKNACVIVLPRFWRAGVDSLSKKDKVRLESLCRALGISAPKWPESIRIPGFHDMYTQSLPSRVKSRGWLLWLSGVFDDIGISFWDTLVDRWKEFPKYQIPDMLLELEVVVAYR